MAFSAKQKALIYALFGMSQDGASTEFLGFNLGNPLVNNVTNAHFADGDHSAVVTKMDARIAAIEGLADNGSEQIIKALLCRFEEILTSPLYLTSKSGSGGVIADDEREIRLIRDRLGSLLGWAQPLGSYVKESDSLHGPQPGDR